MFASAIGYVWIAGPVAFAALVLFVWGFFQTTAALYAELSMTSREKIAALEAALARCQEPPPDYVAWRHVDRLSLKQAAFLWCDLPPKVSMPTNVQAWFNALASAIRRGDLSFEHQPQGYVDADTTRQMEKRNPTLDTIVKRTALQQFAKANRHDPTFLRDD
jgi:hypothetical protein